MNTEIVSGNHPIIITDFLNEALKNWIDKFGSEGVTFFLIADENTYNYCFPLISSVLPKNIHKIIIGAGELHKNLHSCQVVWSKLLYAGADRNSVIINLGGGMVSDLGGFVAATFKRGIKFINIPTSLLGMVDASCGGKTGIDLDGYKNMIGIFAFPQTVIVDPIFLETLPDKEWKNGITEIIKHALIGDAKFWNRLISLIPLDGNIKTNSEFRLVLSETLDNSIKIKNGFVSMDPYEKNKRKSLNFGHTVGHALETWSLRHDDNPIAHGAAIATGMICESFLSMKLCGLPHEELIRIGDTIKKIFPVVRIKKETFSELIHFVTADKKSNAGSVTYALLNEIGKPVLYNGVSEEILYESFHFYNGL